MPDADPPSRSESRRSGGAARSFPFAALACLAVAVLLVFALRPGLDGAASLLPLFRAKTAIWALVAIACQMLMYLCISNVLRAGLGTVAEGAPRIPVGSLVRASAAFLWANRALPGPAVAGLATLVFILGRRDVPSANAQAAAATFYFADYAAFAPLSVVTIVLLARFGHLGALHWQAMCVALALIGAGMGGTVVLLRSSHLAENTAEKAGRFAATVLRRADGDLFAATARGSVGRFYERWNSLTARPAPLVSASFWSLLAHLADTATILCAALAFSASDAFSDVHGHSAIGRYCLGAATAFVTGNLAAIVSFLPAGLGFFEGAMVASLHLVAGLTVAQAALVTVLYRLLSVWLPVPFVLRTARQAIATVSLAAKQSVTE